MTHVGEGDAGEAIAPDHPSTFATQLERLIADGQAGITSARRLARRLSELDGRDPENHRRSIRKYLAGETQPREPAVARIREAFGLDESELARSGVSS